jgi:hypothetical protein
MYRQIKNNGMGGHAARIDQKPSFANLRGRNHSGGAGSSVGIATGYGLDGPGIESRWERDFPHLSKPALGHDQSLVQWVPRVSRG